jgi:hypothetical protein
MLKTKEVVLVSSKVILTANNKTISPTLLYSSALKPDFTDSCLSFQKEINK